MLAQDTQCVQSLCTGRYDALYLQRYRQTTGTYCYLLSRNDAVFIEYLTALV